MVVVIVGFGERYGEIERDENEEVGEILECHWGRDFNFLVMLFFLKRGETDV